MNPIVAIFQSVIGNEQFKSPSPVGNWLEGVLQSASEGEIQVKFKVRKDMTNPAGTLHGGIVSLMADEVIGMAVFSMNNDYHFTSVNLYVDFLAPGREGDELLVTAKVIRQGRSIANTECLIHNTSGKLIARGQSNLVVTSTKNWMKQH